MEGRGKGKKGGGRGEREKGRERARETMNEYAVCKLCCERQSPECG